MVRHRYLAVCQGLLAVRGDRVMACSLCRILQLRERALQHDSRAAMPDLSEHFTKQKNCTDHSPFFWRYFGTIYRCVLGLSIKLPTRSTILVHLAARAITLFEPQKRAPSPCASLLGWLFDACRGKPTSREHALAQT